MGSSCLDLIMNSWEVGGVTSHWERSYNFTRSNCRVFVFYFYLFFTAPFFVSCRYISHLSDFVAFFFSIFLRKDFMRGDLIQICLLFFLFDREIIIIERGRTFCSSLQRGFGHPRNIKYCLIKKEKKETWFFQFNR
jgi:hypothetical protein